MAQEPSPPGVADVANRNSLGSTIVADENPQHERQNRLRFKSRPDVAPEKEPQQTEDKIEITEDDCKGELGYDFSSMKKWRIIAVIFIVQTSMNFNTSLYSNAVPGISERFNISAQAARCGAMIFLVTYAFGCEIFAPWSEELGRKPVLQFSLFLVNIFQLPVALAPNFASIMVGRALGGLSSAGGSVTLGMIADLWESDNQQFAVAAVVFSSVGGSVLGPVVGGFTEQYLSWQWSIWIQLILGGFVQLMHLLFVPETRSTVMMDKIAKQRRKAHPGLNIWGPNEMVTFRERFAVRELLVTMLRPFKMFVTEPIVLTLSLLSGFSDALIFMFIQSFSLVYKQWGFGTVDVGLSFIPLLVGYCIAWAVFIPAIKWNQRKRAENPEDEHIQYESRLYLLLYLAPLLPIGLFGYAWTCTGPPIHWIGSMIFAILIGVANYSIYMATIDYMICAYGPYSASATGGNGWARDFLAGVLTVPATPFFSNIGSNPLAYATTILACISVLLVAAVYVIYWKGETLRRRSPFAQQLSDARDDKQETGHDEEMQRVAYTDAASYGAGTARPMNRARQRSYQSQRLNENMGSRRGTPRATPGTTPTASRANSIVGEKKIVT